LRPSTFASLASIALTACVAVSHDGSPVTAPRPLYSSDTATIPAGSYEVEAGAVFDPKDGGQVVGVFKYGAGERTEVYLENAPYTALNGRDDSAAGFGDVLLGFRHRLVEERGARPSLAFQPTIKLPTAADDDDLGSGEPDLLLAGMATKTIAGVGVTAFYQLGVVGEEDGDFGFESQLALAASGVFPDSRLGGHVELATIHLPKIDECHNLLTLGATYNPGAWLVFDVGASMGLSHAAPDLQLLAGFTHNLGRLAE
jgi:hypothetical protein